MATSDNYIKLPRSILQSEAWNHATVEQVKAFLDLCCRVAYKDMTYDCKQGKIELKKGQMVTSLRTLAEYWNCDFNKAYRILNSLEKNGLVKRENYSERKNERLTILTINALQEQGERESEQENNNNSSNEEFLSQTRAKRFVPPSVEEIQQHLDKKGETRFTAQEFYNFYEARGWLVGKDIKMKSWKGAVATWIDRKNKDKNTNGNRNNYRPHDREAERAEREAKFRQHIIEKLSRDPDSEQGKLPF